MSSSEVTRLIQRAEAILGPSPSPPVLSGTHQHPLDSRKGPTQQALGRLPPTDSRKGSTQQTQKGSYQPTLGRLPAHSPPVPLLTLRRPSLGPLLVERPILLILPRLQHTSNTPTHPLGTPLDSFKAYPPPDSIKYTHYLLGIGQHNLYPFLPVSDRSA